MKRLILALVLVSGCGSSRGGGGGNGGTGGTGGSGDGFDLGADAFYIDDPPPMYCALDGGVLPPPPPPGGTLECPDDKNREGCPCPAEGMTAPCWPGARANRNLGVCHDGMTTCMQFSELALGWGPCMGYMLPVPGATEGANACKCFSHGKWQVDNLSPCFFAQSGMPDGSGGAISTVGSAGAYMCPADLTTVPSTPWSTDTVTTDCEGHFKLCLTLKAGDAKNPQTTDCVVASSCTEADYTTPKMAQTFPPLPAWLSTNTTCTAQFAATGGYGEMSVTGETVTCDMVQSVFNRVQYCPLSCQTTPTDPMCANCMAGGSGNF